MSNLVAGTVDTSCHCCQFHYHYSCWHYGHRYHTISFYPRTKTLTSLQWSQTLFDFFGDDENSATYNYSRLGAEICICSSVRSFCVSCSVVFNSLQPHGLYLTRLLCPWNSPGKNAGWSGLPFPSPGDLSDPGVEPLSLLSPALAGGFFTTSATWEAKILLGVNN